MSIFVLAVMLSSLAEGASPIRLAVLNAAKDSELRQPSEIAANTFTGTLAKSKAVALAEREELDVILHEQKISASELEDSAAKIGGLMGCEYVLLVSLVYSDSTVVSARLVDVATSGIVYSDTEIPDTLDESAMTAASSRMADRVLEVLTGEQAVITEIGSREVIINRGSSSGVRTGDMYRVYKGTKRMNVNLAVIRVKDVRAGFSHAELVKDGGEISILRRSDKVEAISRTEAEKLIKRKNFPRYRYGERSYEDASFKTLRKAADPINEYASYLENVVLQSFDRLGKLGKELETRRASNGNVTADEFYDLGNAWNKLGESISHDKTSGPFSNLMQKLDAVYIDKSDEKVRKIYALFEKYNLSTDETITSCLELAVHYFELAAEYGSVHAMQNLGYMYSHGKGVRQDYAKAVEYYTKAADKGNVNAQNNLGYMYSHGRGVRQDYAKAIAYYTKAADRGDMNAQNNLGRMYEQGHGVPQNLKKAIELYRQAAANGSQAAKNNLQRLGAN